MTDIDFWALEDCDDDIDSPFELDAAAFEVERGDRGVLEGIPGADYPDCLDLWGLWVTLPVVDADGRMMGRCKEKFYPAGSEDEGGCEALHWGACYYREAMEHSEPDERDTRIQCFQAAELFYLHAARRGNIQAFSNLGYVYSYDRCEGHNWEQTLACMESGNPAEGDEEAVADSAFDRDARAFECYSKAAEQDEPEACYKVGDHLMQGRGCEMDADAAYAWFLKSFELGKDCYPVIWGSAAFRLAECHEEGRGCQLSFESALEWYKIAVAGLEAAVEAGDWYYKKVLANARKGLKRMEQELSGGTY